jgi:hypothetical protein
MMIRDLDADNIVGLLAIAAIACWALSVGQVTVASAGLGMLGGYIAK